MEKKTYQTLREFEQATQSKSDTHLSAQYTGNRSLYDDVYKRQKYKESVFQGKETTTDFITGETLHANRQMAIKKYGERRANYHTGQVDHTVPLEQVHSMAKNIPFISDDDVRAAANREWNYRFTQSHLNQSKQSKSNFEMAAQSLQAGKYEEGAKLIGDGVIAHTMVGTELSIRAGKNAVQSVYGTTYDAAEAVSPNLVADVERKISQSAKEMKQNIGEDLRGAAIPITIAAVNALVSVANDEKTLREAGKEVAIQTGMMVASTELQKIGVSVTNQALKQSGVQALQQVAKANIVANAVALGFMVKDSVVSWVDGKLDDEEFVEQVARTGTLLATQTMGALVGQTAIPIPYVGAIVGSLVATVACECIFSLMDAAKNHIAENKRDLVSKIAADALREMECQRNLLKQYIADDKAKWDENVREGFALIATGIQRNDVEIIAGGLDCILTNVNRHVKFSSYEEFDDFFMDENAVLKL